MKDIRQNKYSTPLSLNSDKGSVLFPCLFLLILISLLTLGVQNIGGIGNRVSDVLSEKSQANMAAVSGIEIAYDRLRGNPDYLGEQCAPFDDPGCSVDITVRPLGDMEYEVYSTGDLGDAESRVKTRAAVKPWIPDYPVTIGGDLTWDGKTKVLGESYVNGAVKGNGAASILGDLRLTGSRDVQYDSNGKAVSINGYSIPLIRGDVICDQPVVEFPGVILDELRNLAQAQGQYYKGNKTFKFIDGDLDGVVFVEGEDSSVMMLDVTLNGILVCEGTNWVKVTPHHLFKASADDSVCPGVAILAPDSLLQLQPQGAIDIYGMTYVDSLYMQGEITFSGPIVVQNDFTTVEDHTDVIIQYPSTLKGVLASNFMWSTYYVVELEYEEM